MILPILLVGTQTAGEERREHHAPLRLGGAQMAGFNQCARCDRGRARGRFEVLPTESFRPSLPCCADLSCCTGLKAPNFALAWLCPGNPDTLHLESNHGKGQHCFQAC